MKRIATKLGDPLVSSPSAGTPSDEGAGGAPASASVGRQVPRFSPCRLGCHAAPLIVVIEGKNDVEFLRRISRMLHAVDPRLPDLVDMEQSGRLVFLPCGGRDLESWSWRLAPLGCCAFYLYDRDCLNQADAHRQAAAIVSHRPQCRAVVTAKRTMENYLHPHAILEARGVEVAFSDEDDVADVVARACYEQTPHSTPWELLPLRSRKRYRNHVKGWLNTRAVDRMTASRLAKRDPGGEVRLWLTTIAELAGD